MQLGKKENFKIRIKGKVGKNLAKKETIRNLKRIGLINRKWGKITLKIWPP